MKTIGLLGGMSWESTSTYYRIINETVRRELGGLHSARVLLYSVEFAEVERCQQAGDWDGAARILTEAAQGLERGGADFLAICTNTMHKVAPQLQSGISIPIYHIAEAVAGELKRRGVTKAALLGTKYTMTQDFYQDKLESLGIQVMMPDGGEIEQINGVIFDELCLGIVKDDSREAYLRIMERLAGQGAQGVILGCTEIGMLIQQKHTEIPVFDTTQIHAEQTALLALEP